MFKLYRYLKPYKKEVILGPMFKLVEAIFELIVPLVMAQIIDKGITELSSVSYVIKLGGVLFLLAFLGLCSTLVCQVFASKASQGYGTILRTELYHHINTLSPKELDEIGISSLITRLTADINQMQTSVAMLIRLVVRAPFIVIGSTIMACIINPTLSLIFLGASILVSITIYVIMYFSVPRSLKVQRELDEVTLVTKENITGQRVIKAFNKEEFEKSRFNRHSKDLQEKSIAVGKINALLNPCTSIIINVAIVLVIYFGGIKVNAGSLTQGQITALANYLSQMFIAIVVVSNLVVIFAKASVSAKRINAVFDLKPTIKNGTITEVNYQKEVFKFDHVTFNYGENSKPALSDLNFTINEGETIGIIGGTGSGKSSIVSLMERFYDVTEGNIMFYGRNIKDYDLKVLRDNIGYVPQKAELLKGTIRSNLLFGNSSASEEDQIKALKTSQSYEFVMNKEKGLDSEVVTSGRNFSGGQKQRLTIARALIRNPRVLILDDSSSALDFKTDADLRHDLKANYPHQTSIIISQRATTLTNADKILVIDDGIIVGQGRHEELLQNCQIYREIYNSQMPESEAK